MKTKKFPLTVLFSSTLVLLLLSGCEELSNSEKEEALFERLEFSQEPSLFSDGHNILITTKDRTIIWRDDETTFVMSKDDTNTLSYQKTQNGTIYNQTIHLSPDGLKKYSKTYAETFGESLETTEE